MLSARWQVHVNGETCTGHGRCAKYGPNVCFLDEIDGYNTHRGTTIVVPEGEGKGATMGMKSCPERAIAIIDAPAEGSVRTVVHN